MALPAKIQRVADFYGLVSVADWQSLTAADVLVMDGVGPSALNRLRLYLAHRGLNLFRDNPAAYWLEHLSGLAEGDDQPIERRGVCPFTVIVDSNEQDNGYRFDEITDNEGNLIVVPVVRQPLYLIGGADYSILGLEKSIQIERKSTDLASSLSWRRENFEKEIANLDAMTDFAAIVIEESWSDFCRNHDGHGASIAATARTWVSWSVRFPGVHWVWATNRAEAEAITFALLEKFWWHHTRQDARRKIDSKKLAILREKV